ncbi:hypothetical protein GO730_10620 [Spirosoma sp. HMF3257]|uniref:hypothetical protein n=1 Tax=Spirosoma telluris TaxID=2183553 RepID=UPI0012F75E9D|nr:hypothetical protein [Spirosoma telluris]
MGGLLATAQTPQQGSFGVELGKNIFRHGNTDNIRKGFDNWVLSFAHNFSITIYQKEE